MGDQWDAALAAMAQAADRMDSLAETADLMGDTDGAVQWQARASAMRMRAMSLLDHVHDP
jgi:hypothetical protein